MSCPAVATDVGSVEEIVSSPISIMPTGFAEGLTRQELVDLLRYLSSLGATQR